MARGPRAHRPVENRTTAHRARARSARCGLGCGRGQLATRSSPVRWPRLGRTATAPSRRLQLQTVGVIALNSRGARTARSSSRRESDDRPQSTRAHCAVWTWLWSGPTRDALLTRSLVEAPPHGHRTGPRLWLRTIGVTALDSCGARTAHSSPRRESDDRPRSTRAHCALRTWLWSGSTRDTLLPHSLVEALPHGHRTRSAAAVSKRRCYCARLPWRADRVLIALSIIGRPPTEHARALRGADLVEVLANSRHASPQFVGRGFAARPPHQVGGCGFEL